MKLFSSPCRTFFFRRCFLCLVLLCTFIFGFEVVFWFNICFCIFVFLFCRVLPYNVFCFCFFPFCLLVVVLFLYLFCLSRVLQVYVFRFP